MLLSKEEENETYKLSALQQSKSYGEEPGVTQIMLLSSCKSTTGSQILDAVFVFLSSQRKQYN